MSNPMFNPKWTPVYKCSSNVMGYNERGIRNQMDHTSDQVEAMTREINRLEQEMHELRAELKRRGVEEVILANTSPADRRGPGRPAKGVN